MLAIDEQVIAPPIQSQIRTRPIDLASDWESISSIHEACRQRDQTDRYSVCYKIPNLPCESYSKPVQGAPQDATIILFVGNRPAAHGWMESWGDEEILYLWRLWVDPEYRGLGIGTSLLRWGEAQAGRLHAGLGKPAQHLANATESESDAVQLLLSEGYDFNFVSPELSFDNFGELAGSRLVTGLDFRCVLRSDIDVVAHCLAEANTPHPGVSAPMTLDDIERKVSLAIPFFKSQCNASNLNLSRAAWSGDRLVGVVLASMNDNVGELPQVAVLAEWRGKGSQGL